VANDRRRGAGKEHGGGEHGRRGRSRARQARETLTARVEGGVAELVPDPDRACGWTLVLDGAPQSYVDLEDPAHLDFEYQRRLGHVIDVAAPPGQPLYVLHLGGGALSLARYVAATRPRSTQQVIEQDVALTQWVRTALPLERGWRIRIRGADARAGLGKLPQGWADLVIADVFSGARTPAHLTSGEFLHEVRRVLRTGGLYAANVADGPGAAAGSGSGRSGRASGDEPVRRPLDHVRSQVATAQAAFASVGLLADPAVLRGRRFGNGVLLASDRELPVAELKRRAAGDPRAGRLETGGALADYAAGAQPVTDATARDSPLPPDGVFRR
jgi:hypothetical protein